MSVLARATRAVEAAVERGRVTPAVRTRFQVVALLVREERARVRADAGMSQGSRDARLKRLDGIATILATTAVRDPKLLALLADGADVPDAVKTLKRDMLKSAGIEAPPEEPAPAEPVAAGSTERQVVPQSVARKQLATPFLAPDFSSVRPTVRTHRLAGWELLNPLFTAFERADSGAPACMALPEPSFRRRPGGMELIVVSRGIRGGRRSPGRGLPRG